MAKGIHPTLGKILAACGYDLTIGFERSAPRPEGSSKRSDELTDEQCRFLLDECFKPVSDWPDEDLQALSEHDPDPPDDSHKGLVRKLAAEVLRLRRAEGSEGR